MADEETKEDGDAAPKPKGNLILIILVAINMLGLIGGGVYVMFFSGGSSAAAAPAEEEAPPVPEEDRFGPLVEFNPIVANLANPGETRYVKVTLHMEVANEEQKIKLEEMMIPVRDRMVLHFSGLTSEQTLGEAFKVEMKEKIAEMANEVAGVEMVRNVYFGEFVIQ